MDFETDFNDDFFENHVEKTPVKPRRTNWIFIAAGVIFLLVLGFFTIHLWKGGSCTEAAVCKICGKVSKKMPGHRWQEATCTEAWICLECGEVKGEALGHTWFESVDQPIMVCSVCGLVQDVAQVQIGPVSVLDDVELYPDGRVKTGYEFIGGERVEWEYVSDYNNVFLYRKRMIDEVGLTWNTKFIPNSQMTYQDMDYTVRNCIGFTFIFNVTDVPRGTGRGERNLMVLDDRGNWEIVTYFDYPEYVPVEVEVTLEEPMNLMGIGTLKLQASSNNIYSASGEMVNVWVIDYTY